MQTFPASVRGRNVKKGHYFLIRQILQNKFVSPQEVMKNISTLMVLPWSNDSSTQKMKKKLWLLEKVDRKSSGFIPVRRDKWFFSCRRSRVTFFKPYISAKRQLCSSSSLAIESNIDHSSTCMQEAQDLSQCNKELTRDEEQFLIDVVFK